MNNHLPPPYLHKERKRDFFLIKACAGMDLVKLKRGNFAGNGGNSAGIPAFPSSSREIPASQFTYFPSAAMDLPEKFPHSRTYT
jgi:hypothetical protein